MTEKTRRVAGLTGAAGLAAAAAVHGLWATGSTWPTASSNQLANLVMGQPPMPGPLACAAVATALGAAAVATTEATIAPDDRRSRIMTGIAALSAAGLAVRGLAGLTLHGLAAMGLKLDVLSATSEQFQTWDRRLYSPLCLTLAVLVWIGITTKPGRAPENSTPSRSEAGTSPKPALSTSQP